MLILGLKGLKGLCQEDIAVLGQYCAENITKFLYPYTKYPCTVQL